MEPKTLKEIAHQIVDELPDDSSWEDLMYRLYARQAIEAGLQDSENERVESVESVRQRFGLST